MHGRAPLKALSSFGNLTLLSSPDSDCLLHLGTSLWCSAAQRAKLLLTLKAMSSPPSKGPTGSMSLVAICTNGQAEEMRVSWIAQSA